MPIKNTRTRSKQIASIAGMGTLCALGVFNYLESKAEVMESTRARLEVEMGTIATYLDGIDEHIDQLSSERLSAESTAQHILSLVDIECLDDIMRVQTPFSTPEEVLATPQCSLTDKQISALNGFYEEASLSVRNLDDVLRLITDGSPDSNLETLKKYATDPKIAQAETATIVVSLPQGGYNTTSVVRPDHDYTQVDIFMNRWDAFCSLGILGSVALFLAARGCKKSITSKRESRKLHEELSQYLKSQYLKSQSNN